MMIIYIYLPIAAALITTVGPAAREMMSIPRRGAALVVTVPPRADQDAPLPCRNAPGITDGGAVNTAGKVQDRTPW